jgi:tetratricopeptide (TPR) repeat protein
MNRLSVPPASRPRSFSFVFLFVAIFVATLTWQTAAQMNMSSPVMETKDEIPTDQLPVPQKMSGVGNVHMQISATPEAQAWFDQGLNLIHDFWDYEAARAFEQSVRVDPQCAMCYWGVYRAESFYHGTAQGYAGQALAKAQSLEKRASKRERLYIEADVAREAMLKNAKGRPDPSAEIALRRKLVKEYPKDSQARITLAWAVGGPEGIALLEGVMKDEPNNSAANHYYIHELEGSDHPERALHSAEILPSLAPASGHMVHMPGHIFFRVGDYARAEQAFNASMRVDETYMREQHVAVDDDWNYVHNLMYAVANLMEEGKMKEATALSAKLTGARGELDSTLYSFSARDSISRLNPELPVALRTGDWAQVMALSQANQPPAREPNLRLLARALDAFATGMEAVEQRDLPKAEASSTQFDAEMWRASQDTKAGAGMRNNMGAGAPTASTGPLKMQLMPDAQLGPLVSNLAVMSLELRASVLTAQKQSDEAKKIFKQAAQAEKDLGYHEPPNYIRPVGETEAAALMAAGDYVAAKAAYQQALVERPRSGFPLYGIALSSEKAGDLAAAAKEYSDFLAAWKDADADLAQLTHARTYVAEHPTGTHSQPAGF